MLDVGLYTRCLLPRILDRGMDRAEIAEVRAAALSAVRGRVIEVGFGSGLNLAHYPPGVESLCAVDPSNVAWKIARPRVARARFGVVRLWTEEGRILTPEAAFDAAVTTFTLCTVRDLPRTLAEIRRALAPGGRLHFVEHGLVDDERVRRWQRRWNPWQMRLAGGCRVDREFDREIEAAGFRIEALAKGYLRGPRVLSFLYRGTAVRR